MLTTHPSDKSSILSLGATLSYIENKETIHCLLFSNYSCGFVVIFLTWRKALICIRKSRVVQSTNNQIFNHATLLKFAYRPGSDRNMILKM